MDFKKVLNAVFPPYIEPKLEKPREMLYIANDKPDRSTILVVGAQHALIILALIAFPVIVGKAIGLTGPELRSFIALSILVLGLATIIQNLPTRFGSGYLIVHNPSVISMATFIAVSGMFGIGAAAGGVLLAGVIIMFFSRFLPKFQTLFPAEITGVLLLILGLSMVEGGVRRSTGIDAGSIDVSAVLVAAATLGTIVFLAIWTSGRIRVFSVAAGIAAGLIVAALTGQFGSAELAIVAEEPLFAFPFGAYDIPSPKLIIAAAVPILIIEIINAVDSIGTAVAVDKMNNAKWSRPDMPLIGRTVTCHGICVVMNGLTGTLPSGTSSANIGLVAVTGVAARIVGITAGIMLVAMAFLPQVSTLMTLMPVPVIGALVIYTAGYMMVVGMELILSRLLNSRRQFMVGLSVTVGMAILVVPEVIAGVSQDLKPVLGSALTMGVITAVVLNQIFRIGIAQHAEVVLEGLGASAKAARFLEGCGLDWGARRDVINRAGLSVGEALEVLRSEGMANDDVLLRASFDEYKVKLVLEYEGNALPLGDEVTAFDVEAFMDDEESGDEALDLAMAQMSNALIQKLADIVSSNQKGERAELHMHFSH